MKGGEKGFTLIEMIAVVAIMALVASGATMTFFQVVKGTERSNEQITAVRQVQNSGYWISRDTHMAQEVGVAGGSGFPLTLTWTDWDSGDKHQVIYTLENMPSSELKQLQRRHYINQGASKIGLVAQYIDADPSKTKCEFTDGVLTLRVTATVSLGSEVESETRTYKIQPRPGL